MNKYKSYKLNFIIIKYIIFNKLFKKNKAIKLKFKKLPSKYFFTKKKKSKIFFPKMIKKIKFFFKKKKIKYINFNITIKNKKKTIHKLIYFLKYFTKFRKKIHNTVKLSKIKLSMFKNINKNFKKHIKNFIKYNNFKKLAVSRYNNLYNLHIKKKKKNLFKINKLYDIKKKYIRYFINNRYLYKFLKIKKKQNYKFYKYHFRFISSLNIKSRLNFFENTLKNIIIKLKLAYSVKSSLYFIRGGLIFINGLQCLENNINLKKNDYIELIVCNLLFFYKNRIKRFTKKNIWLYKKHMFKKLKIKEKQSNLKLKKFKLSEIFLYFKNKIYNIFELDIKSSTLIFFKNNNIKYNISYFNKKYIPIYYLKLLNWKIIS